MLHEIVFIDYRGYQIETAPNGYWVMESIEGEGVILATVKTIEDAKKEVDKRIES